MRSKKRNSNTIGPSTYHNDNVALDSPAKITQAMDETAQKLREAKTDEEKWAAHAAAESLFHRLVLSVGDYRSWL